MGELFIWVSGLAGLVTLGVFFRHLLHRRVMDNELKDLNMPDFTNLPEILTIGEVIALAKRNVIRGTDSTVFLDGFSDNNRRVSREARRIILSINHGSKTSTPLRQRTRPRTLRILGSHLPSELQEFKEEFMQCLEDGLADRPKEKHNAFLLSESADWAISIGKFQLFKLKKSWRRTIK